MVNAAITSDASASKKNSSPRSSISSIPLPDLKQIAKFAKERRGSKENLEPIQPIDEREMLRGELCSAYKFVVNYGVFEQNFEWLPEEVSIQTSSLDETFRSLKSSSSKSLL